MIADVSVCHLLVERDHHNQNDSDRRSDAGPFGDFHGSNLPPLPILVERIDLRIALEIAWLV
jgi:hypothetical protein